MARQGVTEQEITEAAESLAQAGQPVTVSAVRDLLGTGSYSTINQHLAKWRDANTGRKADGVPDMPESIGRTMRQLWGVAWNEAQDGIKAEREALEAARREMERERHDMAAEIARLEAENATQAETIGNLTGSLAAKDEALAAGEKQAHGLQIENTRLETDNAAKAETIKRLEADNAAKAATLDRHAAELTAKTEAVAAAEKRGQALTIENAAKDETIKRLEVEKDAQGATIAKLEADNTAKVAALAAADKEAQALRIENARLDERAKAAESNAADLRGEVERLHTSFREAAAAGTEPASTAKPAAPKKKDAKPDTEPKPTK